MTTSEPTSAADGAWERLDDLERRARDALSPALAPFRSCFQDTYEAGVIVPVLRASGQAKLDVRHAALFYKRLLNDLRAIWLLLHDGYTSQAASVGASLYENSLATACLLMAETNIAALLESDSGEIPWSPMQMTKMIVEHEGKKPSTPDYENEWRALYASYVWLCQLKHPTLDSVVHDTSASTLDTGQYVVMAMPNVRTEDLPLKAMLAIGCLLRTHETIIAFASTLGYHGDYPSEHDFAERFQRARASLREAVWQFQDARPPVTMARSWFNNKYPPVEEEK